MSTRKVRHLLVTASYEGERVLPHEIRAAVKELMAERGVEPVAIVPYETTICMPGVNFSLTEAWQGLSTDERLYLKENMPRLFTAIFLALRGTTPPQPLCEESSPTTGYRCQRRGPHVTHFSFTMTDRGGGPEDVW